MRHLLILVIAIASLSGAEALTLSGEDDAKGGKRLGAWLAANDIDATTLENNQVKVKGKVLTILVAPRLTKDGIDRLLATAFFTVTDEAKADAAALTAMVMTLNAENNLGCFSLDQDNDLVLQSQMTFVDALDFDEVNRFLEWFDTSAFVLLTKNQQASAMLK